MLPTMEAHKMILFLFYTDPGSGVMLLQVLLAFFAGGVFYFRNLIRRVFTTGKHSEVDQNGSASQPINHPGNEDA